MELTVTEDLIKVIRRFEAIAKAYKKEKDYERYFI